MEGNKYRKFYVDWWNIRKSTIYGVLAVVVVIGAAGGGAWWASKNNWFVQTSDTEVPKDAARIVSFEGEVRLIRGQTRETILVTRETYVAAGDTIQTQSDGRAMIQMIDGSLYSVRPNSTVVLGDSSSLLGGKRVRVRVNDGQLNVRTNDQPADSKNIVELGDSENELQSKTDASFNTNGANGGEIRISRGSVETTIAGDKTTIGENEYASINNGKLSAKEKLMAAPRPIAPENSVQLTDASGRGINVVFTWQDSEAGNAVSYYLQVAKSPIFASDSILVDRGALTTREFKLSGLVPGTYYWRLRSTGRSGQTTNWNDAWKFTVVKGSGSVNIEVSEWSVEPVGGNIYLISGRTQPGMVVRALGRSVFAASDGTFKLQISTPSTEAYIEVGDDRGNRGGYILSMRTGNLIGRY
jgi:hypothetical protein